MNDVIKSECKKMSIEQRKAHIMKLADDMAAAATSLNSQSYESFLQARERLQTTIDAVGNLALANDSLIKSLIEVLRSKGEVDLDFLKFTNNRT